MIALRILQELQQHPARPELAALPIVGEGDAYARHGIPIIGPVQAMPSGGFIYMDGRQLARDLRGGLLKLTRMQLKTVRAWAKSGGVILAVGDIVPLLFAWWSGAAYAFVGTAKSEYYLRDEQGWLPRQSWFERLESWSGSVYLPWERWLMRHPNCKAVFPRDRLTTSVLQKWNVPAFDLGNPMMDGLTPAGPLFQVEVPPEGQLLTLVLLPGSREPEAYENWQVILQAVTALVDGFPDRTLLFLAAIAPQLNTATFLQAAEARGWHLSHSSPISADIYPTSEARRAEDERSDERSADPPFERRLTQYRATLILTHAFNTCLHQADFAIAMAGTATEQFVGLGKPAITLPGRGPQFTAAFAEAQTRLLGPSITGIAHPSAVVRAVQSLLADPDRLQLIAHNGSYRMGKPGAARRIADCLVAKLATEQ